MFVRNSDVKAVPMVEGVERKIMGYGQDIMTVEVILQKGAVVPLHTHIHEQVSYVIKGSFEFTVSGESRVLNTGDSVYMASNAPHQVTVLEEGIIVDSFSPIREDFIE